MPRKSAAAAPPPPRADDVANDPDLADFLKQLVNVDDAGGDRFLHPRGAANADAVWSDLDNLDVSDPIYMSLGAGGGALGALAFGIGASDVFHVLATQTTWQRKPDAMRVTVNG